MFSKLELIRIYYALKEDAERREKSEHAGMMSHEIEMDRQIMLKISENRLVDLD